MNNRGKESGEDSHVAKELFAYSGALILQYKVS